MSQEQVFAIYGFNPFRQALEWFGPDGERWSHGDSGSWDVLRGVRTSACSVSIVCDLGGGVQLLDEVAGALFPERLGLGDLRSAASVNDHPDTTFDDIRTIFEKAAVRWDERID